MSNLTIPNLKLFPLYTGGPILNGKNGLNGSSQFTIPATRYSLPWAVNIAPQTNPFDPSNYFSFSSKNAHYLTSNPISSATDYTTMLGIDTSVPGHLAKVSAPATAPEIPQVFQDRVANYTVSDANFNALMAQSSFEIPGIGMGLLVTTDGNGNVASESINPSSWDTMRRANAVGHDLGVLNRAEITMGAIYKVVDPGYGFSSIDKPGNPAALQAKKTQTPSAVGALGSQARLQNAGIFNTQPNAANPLAGPDALLGADAATNPLIAKLDQLQPQDMGLALSGADSAADLTQAQQVATSQADYGLNLSDNFYQNVASVVNAANAQQQNSYAANFAPRVVEAMDGRVNVMPWQLPPQANQGPMAAPNAVSFDMGASVADATSGNAKNGYMPFNMQNNGSSAGGGFADANPFAGSGSSQSGYSQGGHQGNFQGGMQSGHGRQSGQQSPFYRRPLAYTA